MRHLGWPEGMQPYFWEFSLDGAESIGIVFESEVWMVAALQQQLVSSPLEGLPDFFPVGIHGGDIGLCMAGDAVEVAELAIRDAHVGGIDVAIDLPAYFSVGHLLFSEFIRHMHQVGQWRFLEQKKALFCC